jgi:hypothetical protein
MAQRPMRAFTWSAQAGRLGNGRWWALSTIMGMRRLLHAFTSRPFMIDLLAYLSWLLANVVVPIFAPVALLPLLSFSLAYRDVAAVALKAAVKLLRNTRIAEPRERKMTRLSLCIVTVIAITFAASHYLIDQYLS